MKQKIETEVEIPEGYEATGEYRNPEYGELFLSSGDCVACEADCMDNTEYKKFILRKVEPEQPEYKAFEIDWNQTSYPVVKESTGLCYSANPGQKVGDYRIFRFGDEPVYNYLDSAPQPSQQHGNYRYAYGRLEK